MRTLKVCLTWIISLCMLGFISTQLHAQDVVPVANVVAFSGEVTAAGTDGEIRALELNSPIYSGDTVATGPASRMRILFSDGSAKTLRPNSRLVIDEYRYASGSEPEPDSSVVRLLRGGMHALTGAIGSANPEAYRVETPVATIGIRGTEYLARFCHGDCSDLHGEDMQVLDDGLYTHTILGRTIVGGVEVGQGMSSKTSMDGITNLLDEMPAVLEHDLRFYFFDEQLAMVFFVPAKSHGMRPLLCD